MLGCDIIEIGRIRDAYDRYGKKFLERVLTEKERYVFYEKGSSITFLAGRFAAKEAVSKSLKTGIGESLSFQDIEVLNGERGEPLVRLFGAGFEDIIVDLSISHCRDYAMAVCRQR